MQVINLENPISSCPIELNSWFDGVKWIDGTSSAADYDRIFLLAKDYKGKGFDLIMCYMKDIPVLHKGQFNSGQP